MGSDPAARVRAGRRTRRRASVVPVAAFRIGRTPVTNAEYAASSPPPAIPPRRTGRAADPARPGAHPVTYVSGTTRARSAPGPGAAADRGRVGAGRARRRRAHVALGRRAPRRRRARPSATARGPSPVGLHPVGASPFGALDLAGNAWEWTASAYGRIRTTRTTVGRTPTSPEPRVVRGGAYSHGPGEIRCSSRHGMLAGAVDHYVGFRLACAPARPALDLDLVDVPAGDVLLGNDPRAVGGSPLADEAPRHVVACRVRARARRRSRTRSTSRSCARPVIRRSAALGRRRRAGRSSTSIR